MTITEFANIRKIQSQTISKYIKRHQEQFPELKKKGRTIELTEEAIKILEEKYPMPKPQTIMRGISHQKYEKILEENIVLKNEINELKQKNIFKKIKDLLKKKK